MSTPPRDRARFVITGLGAVSAYGWGVDALWNGLLSGRTAIGTLGCFAGEGHRTDVSAEVGDPPAGVAERYPEWEELSRAERFARVAVDEAVGQAGGRAALIGDAPELVGVFFGGSTAGMVESEEVFRPSGELSEGDPLRDPELRMLASQPLDVPAATVARHLGAGGTVVTVSSACASGTQALGVALDALRAGEVEVAVVGGADSLCRLTYAGFNSLRVVDERACRPFRAGRAGMTLGEGAGVVVIEPEKRVRARGGRAFATLLGVGNSCDAHHMTAPHPEGLGAALAVERALRDAGLPADVSTLAFLNAHGTGTPLNDLSEWRGVASVFGGDASRVPLTATKASVGHLLGSSGAIEAVVTALSLDRATVPPTPRTVVEPGGPDEEIDPETPGRLVLGEALEIDFPDDGARSVALSTSFGFGGANAAAAFGRVAPEPAAGNGDDA